MRGAAKSRENQMKYAVMFEIEHGEPEHVRVSNPFNRDTPVLVFDNKEDAEREAKNWNTGVVVEWWYS